jgi:starch synthase
MKILSIISISAEVAPFSKTGGLADVARSLPKSLKRLGHSVVVITPYYRQVIDREKYGLKKIFADVPLTIGKHTDVKINYYRAELMRGLPIYFVGCDKYFGRKKQIYGSEHENRRYMIFDAAALKLIELLKLKPDIIHCHDWHTGLIPELIKKDPQFKQSEWFAHVATVFTIHNLTFQFGHNWWDVLGPKRDKGITPLPDLYKDRDVERVNFTKRAILNADVVNAVSETYADEILQPIFGQDLHRILKHRQNKLFGVVNGIDYREFNPARDPGLSDAYSIASIKRKELNKKVVQKRYNLKGDPRACIIIMTSRISEQKGFDILLPTIPTLLQFNLQMIFMGDGDAEYTKRLAKYAKQFPDQMVITPFDDTTETMLYAGGDLALFPSRFEPCGINQLKSMRYGCIPVAREIGGLSDTVTDVDVDRGTGNGFLFPGYDPLHFIAAMARAYAHFQHRGSWRDLVVRAMQQSNSWELPAKKYIELYKKAIKFHHENNNLG